MLKKIIVSALAVIAVLQMTPNRLYAEDDSNTKTFYVSYTVMAHVSFLNGDIEFSQDVIPGEPMNEPSHLQIDGYEFVGWFLNDQLWNFADPVNEHMNLIAKYRLIDQSPSDSVDNSSGSFSLPKTGVTAMKNTSVSKDTGYYTTSKEAIYQSLYILLLLIIATILIPDKYIEEIIND